jgi:hypothetical protein
MDEEETTGGDIVDFIKRYRNVLDQLDEKLGDDFPLWDVIEKFDRESDFTAEIKERNERQGKPTGEPAAKPAEPEPTPTEPAPPADAAATSPPASAATPATPLEKPVPPTADSSPK